MKFRNHKCKRISRKCLDKIIISKIFQYHPPKSDKFIKKMDAFMSKKKLSPIIVDENYILVDGYCSYLIAMNQRYKGHKLKIYMAQGLEVKQGDKK